MKSIYIFLFSFFMVLSACNNPDVKQGIKEASLSDKSEIETPVKLLRHVVLFNFNDDATSDIIKNIEQEFSALKNKISEIHSFEWGINNSPEGLDKGFTHCFLVSFSSEEGRAKYLPHPEHQKFVELIGPYIEDVTVVDYWTK